MMIDAYMGNLAAVIKEAGIARKYPCYFYERQWLLVRRLDINELWIAKGIVANGILRGIADIF